MSAPARPCATAAVRAGALGGLAVAVFDAVPSVLWLPGWVDRLALVARLFGLLAAAGALGGLLLAGLLALGARFGRSPWVRGAPLAVAAAGPVVALSLSLARGGQVSRLPGAQTVSLALAALATAALWWLAPRIRLHGVPRLGAIVPLFLAVALSVANRLAYPRHYAPAHAALTVATLVAAGVAAFLVWPREPRRGWPWPLLALAPALWLGATLSSLPDDHDGRAALLSPRAASARSLMLGLAPVLYAGPGTPVDAALIAAARRRRRVESRGGLPTWDHAHLVLITVDALRADHLGAYGYRREGAPSITPHLDAVAAEGVRFDRAWTPTPRSSYAICSLMTGRALLPRGAPRAPTLADGLGAAGFYTAAFYPDGIFFHDGQRLGAYRDRELGFARRDAEYRDADSRTDAALEELADLSRRGEPRAFLWVHYFDVHEPYEATRLGTAPLDRYDSEILKTDAAIGRLLEGLDALEREVVLVVSADHGEEFLDHGGRFHGDSLYEEQLRVPLLVRAPDLPPRVVETPVSLLDVAPTVRGMLGLPARGADGYDLRPALLGRRFERPPVRATEAGMRAVLDWPFKLIEDERVGGVRLFDLAADPLERVSLASAAPERVEALRAALAAFDAP